MDPFGPNPLAPFGPPPGIPGDPMEDVLALQGYGMTDLAAECQSRISCPSDISCDSNASCKSADSTPGVDQPATVVSGQSFDFCYA